jgi:two-component system, NtrC family, response regulator AtoC
LRSARNRAEIQAIQQALGYSGWNRRRAARLLEISYRSLLLKIQQYKITRQTQ